MKILFLVSSLDTGGAERVATTLCNAWAARQDEVTLIATFSGGGQPFYPLSPAVKLIYLADVVGTRRKSILSYARRFYALRRLIEKTRPDVLISFLSNVNVAAVVSSAFLHIPLVICERTDPSVYQSSARLKILCKLTYRFADALTVQTKSVARKVRALYPGLRDVRAIPNPLPEEVPMYRKKTDNDRKILLSLGRLSSEKQIDTVLKVFSRVSSRLDDWDLHIYGDGPLRASLQSQIEELALQGRAFLKGRTTEPWQIMASADAFVMSSRYEGFPNALLEAMAVGLPCIVFDCPSGPREITRNGKDALLVPLDDCEALASALSRVMDSRDIRGCLGSQARESVCKRFSLSEVMHRWDRLFKEIGVIR